MVNSVNGTSNQSNLGYVAGAALVGGGVAGTAGYLTKSFHNEGIPTDEFLKRIASDDFKECLVADNIQKSILEEMGESTDKKKLLEIFDKKINEFDGEVKKVLSEMRAKVSEFSDENAVKNFLLEQKSSVDQFNSEKKNMFAKIYDSTNKKWIELGENAKKNRKSIQDKAKTAVRNMKLKSAGIWGAAAAIPLAIVTYFMTKGGKSAPTEQGLDQQV